MSNAASMQLELKKFYQKIDGVRAIAKDKRLKKSLLKPGATIVQQGLVKAAPHGRAIHYRYQKGIAKGLKAPKGTGRVVATYYPGNLQHSISILNFTKSDKLFVGSMLAKGVSPKGEFGHAFGKADGYYLHMVENRNPFWVKKVEEVKARALAISAERFQKWTDKQLAK